MILNPREDSLTSISLFFFLWGVVKDCTSKEKRWNQTFGKQAMTYDAILKQAWGNYLIIAFINNQFLTSICLSTSFITSKDTARPLGKTAGTEGTHGKKRSKMTIISDILRQNPCSKGIVITPGAMSPRKKTTREEGDASILLSRGQRNLVSGNHGNKMRSQLPMFSTRAWDVG